MYENIDAGRLTLDFGTAAPAMVEFLNNFSRISFKPTRAQKALSDWKTLLTPQEDMLIGGTHVVGGKPLSGPEFYKPLALTKEGFTLERVRRLRNIRKVFLVSHIARTLGYEDSLALEFAPLDRSGQTLWDPIVAGLGEVNEHTGRVTITRHFEGMEETRRFFSLLEASSVDLGLRPQRPS